MKQCKKDIVCGCAGLAEKDWVGKYQCEYYKKMENKRDAIYNKFSYMGNKF